MKKITAFLVSAIMALTALPISAAASGADLKSATTASFSEVIEENLKEGKAKYYKYSIAESGTLSFYITGFSITDSAEAVIYDANFKFITKESLYGSKTISTSVKKGTYYLSISSEKERDFRATPSFTPSSQAKTSADEGKGTTAIKGATTPFDKTGEAFGFDEAKSDTLEAGKTKYYILEVPEAGALSFYITGFSITDNAEIAIFDKNAKFVCRESLYGSKTISADVVKGTYYAVISTNKERSYQITPSFEPSHTPTITLSMSVKKGKTLTIGTILNTKNDKVTWTTANKKIATVSSKGKIKGVKKGTTTITAKTKSGLEVEIQIKVK